MNFKRQYMGEISSKLNLKDDIIWNGLLKMNEKELKSLNEVLQ